MEFGFTLKPDVTFERAISLARLAERSGFTYGWIFDSHVLWKEPYVLLTLMAQNTSAAAIRRDESSARHRRRSRASRRRRRSFATSARDAK
jgi:hypothetical protein